MTHDRPSSSVDVTFEDLSADTWPDERLPPRMSEHGLADHWQVSTRTLQRWRAAGQGPAWLRIGKKVVYRRADIRAYEAAQIRGRFSDRGQA